MSALVKNLKKSFGFDKTKPVTVAKKQKAYELTRSISAELPWMEYDKKSKCFLLQDGMSVAAFFEIEDVACEATPEE